MWVQYYDFEKDSTLPLLPIIVCVILLIAGIFLFGIRNWIDKNDKRISLFIAKIFMALVLIGWTSTVIIALTSEYLEFDSDKCTIIEGKVTNFRKGKGRKPEKFTVNNVEFSYGNKGLFRTSLLGYEGSGEIIKAGMYVRIEHYKSQILRLWVFEDKKKK